MLWLGSLFGVRTGGPWSSEDLKLQINILELYAASLAIRSFVRSSGLFVQIMLDNTTALHYLNECGRTKSQSLWDIVTKIALWCEERSLMVEAFYVPCKNNWIADQESRMLVGPAD